MPRSWLSEYQHLFSGLLMDEAQLLNPRYSPPVPLEEIFRTKIRPAIFFLQRCTVESGTYHGPHAQIPVSEKALLRVLMVRLVATVVSPSPFVAVLCRFSGRRSRTIFPSSPACLLWLLT